MPRAVERLHVVDSVRTSRAVPVRLAIDVGLDLGLPRDALADHMPTYRGHGLAF
jgi:hypothetical protein